MIARRLHAANPQLPVAKAAGSLFARRTRSLAALAVGPDPAVYGTFRIRCGGGKRHLGKNRAMFARAGEVEMQVPRGALVLVVEGEGARLLRNRGCATALDLEAIPNAVLRRCGTRDPSVSDIVAAVDPLLAGGTALILIAPEQELAMLRDDLPPRARQQLYAEIGSDRPGPSSAGSMAHILCART